MDGTFLGQGILEESTVVNHVLSCYLNIISVVVFFIVPSV